MEPRTHKEPWSWRQWGVVIVIVAVMVFLTQPQICVQTERSQQVKAMSNCRQIISALHLYAGDHAGAYPDSDPSQPMTANAAFRLLIKDDIIQDERIFGCPWSPFNGDNNIGTAPDFIDAIEANENHWMLVGNQKEDAPDNRLLVFENCLTTQPPLRWKPHSAGELCRGRTWKKNKVLIGRNDNSVASTSLNSDGTLPQDTTPPIDLPPDAKILDIETAP